MNATPSSRWLRFSLRGLLVIITGLCLWLGWETNVVRGRNALKAEMQKKGTVHFTTAAEHTAIMTNAGFGAFPTRISFVRQILGDEAIQTIWFYEGYPDKVDVARLEKAFPEAEVQEILPEPCHPGCFPAGTLVETPHGERPIEELAVGDRLVTILPDGTRALGTVESIFVTLNTLWKVDAADGSILTTQTQPLCRADGTIEQVGKLRPGDLLLRSTGKTVREVELLEVTKTAQVAKVYNVILGDSQNFIAGGFVARSKPPASAAESEPAAEP